MSQEHSPARDGQRLDDDEDLLTDVEIADWFRLKPQTLRAWRVKGIGPEWIQIESAIRYRRGTARRYLNVQSRQNTVQANAA